MANTPPNFRASGDIRPCRFVKISGNFTVAEADANEDAVGVAYQDGKFAPLNDLVTTNNHAASGDIVRLYSDGDVCLLEYGGTVTAGQYLKSDADGKGVAVATTGTTNQLARALALDGGSSGEKHQVMLVRQTIRPALV